VNGTFTSCQGSIGPSAEICDGLDNDCDGTVDNGITCNCVVGETQPCGSNIGACEQGSRSCVNGDWSLTCVGMTGPTIELCDGIDNNCNGLIDDNCTVPAGATCDDGSIPQTGCYCEGMLYKDGYCYDNIWAQYERQPFPWIILIIVGAVILVVLVISVILKYHKKEDKVTWESLENGLKYMPKPVPQQQQMQQPRQPRQYPYNQRRNNQNQQQR
jgi:hypothetical protein